MNTLSVVIEWENQVLAKTSRAVRMLQQLAEQGAQLRESGGWDTIELIVLADEDSFEPDSVASMVSHALAGGHNHFSLRVIPTRGLNYYQQKNHGVMLATGEWLLFLDSDVIPQPGWLQILVEGVRDHDVQILGGVAVVDPESFAARVMALGWKFDLQHCLQREGVVSAGHFYANNVIARREFWLLHPFEPRPNCDRGACAELAHRLVNSGIPVYRANAARVLHPAPNGLKAYYLNAMSDGRAHVLSRLEKGKLKRWQLYRPFLRFLSKVIYSLRRVVSGYRHVGLASWQIPAAVLMISAYYLIKEGASLVTMIYPRFAYRLGNY